MAKYPIHEEDEWIRPKRQGYKMMCCDCGLVHKVFFAWLKYQAEMHIKSNLEWNVTIEQPARLGDGKRNRRLNDNDYYSYR